MFHPCDILPEELWRHHLCDKLSPKDLLSLSDAHPFWFQLLERRRPTILMQACLPIITSLKTASNEAVNLGRPTPIITLSHADLLNIRLVCKGCNQTVERYFQEHAHENKPFINERNPQDAGDFLNDFIDWEQTGRVAQRRPEVLYLATNANPGRFARTPRELGVWLDSIELQQFPNANPILSREVIFKIVNSTSVELEQNAIDIVTRCLREHGRHLLRCTFVVQLQREEATFERQYSLLREWLQLVPNLISLDVDFFQDTYLHASMAELETRIRNNPLPDLPRLSKLRMQQIPPPVTMALLKKYKSVETLELITVSCPGVPYAPVNMERLTTFAVRVKGTAELTGLQQLLTQTWLVHLRQLEIYFFSIIYNHLEWRDAISFLNDNFSRAENLVKLYLVLPRYASITQKKRTEIFMDTQTLRLMLPQVEQLKFIAGHLFQMDFLLPMRNSLRKMSIVLNCDTDYTSRNDEYPPNINIKCQQLIRWNGWIGEGHLLKSNIWEAFPNLDLLRVQKRKGWTYRRRQGNPVFIRADGSEERLENSVVDWEQMAKKSVGGKVA